MTSSSINPLAAQVQKMIDEQIRNAGKAIVINAMLSKLHPEARRTVRIVTDFVKSR